jgi:hypothetical protein
MEMKIITKGQAFSSFQYREYIASDGRMMDDELERFWKEAIVA